MATLVRAGLIVGLWALGAVVPAIRAMAQGPSGFNPAEMVSRLDQNGNGQIEPNELQGRGGFMERAVREAGLDPSQSIPVNRLQQIMRERMERSRSQGGGGGGGDRRDRDRRDGDRREGDRRNNNGNNGNNGDTSKSNRPSTPAPAPVPLAPGFVTPEAVDKVPGFGPTDPYVAMEKKYGSRIVGRVRDALKRYDRNGNGYVEGDEMTGSRWSTDPKLSDKNKDGRLSLDELAQRYVERDAARNGDSSGSSGGMFSSGSSSPSSNSGSTSGQTPDSRLASFADAELKQYDTNHDGLLQKDEWTKMPKDMKKWDKNNDDNISKDELVERLASYSRGGSGGKSGRGGKSSSGEAKTYRFRSPIERLPEGLPSWFAARDANADGQVRMSEYATAWNDSKAAEFAKYDLNSDGLITPKECLAVEGVAKK